MSTDLPASSGTRSDEEGDWIARQFFAPADLQMSPEEYAARHAHLLGCFALHLYRYRDSALGEWARRLGEILSTAGEIERCRQRFLTPEEWAAVREQEAKGF
jgi:hypothetical protein